MATVQSSQILTAEDFRQLPADGSCRELVRGRVIDLPPTGFDHGWVCGRVVLRFGGFVDAHDQGHIVCNDAGVITERDPDTVRGPDVAFYPYSKIPKGTRIRGYPAVPPDIAFEIKSPTDGWPKIYAKVAEYLAAGVEVVCVLDPQRETATLYCADQPEQTMSGDQEIAFPALVPGFTLPVRKLFE